MFFLKSRNDDNAECVAKHACKVLIFLPDQHSGFLKEMFFSQISAENKN